MSRAYLGIDIGTFESKGVVVAGDGRVLASARRPHRMIVPRAGWAEHDAEAAWWGEFASISRELTADAAVSASEIRAVGASGIGPCMLPVDADGQPLMNAALYGVDTRAAAEIEELTAEIGRDALLASGGNLLTSQSVGPKILWLRKHRPELFARTDKILNSNSFLVRRLTGRTVIDHYSGCGFSPLYDIATRSWTDRYADRIVAPERLPELCWSTDVVGGVTAAAAEATGLMPGTPVIAGTIDAASEAVSVGVCGPGQMMVMYGSTIFIILVTDRRVEDPRLWYSPWLFEGRHACMAGLATSGTLTHWFRDQFARELDPAEAMRRLAEEAATSPAGAKGLVVLPYFSGERTPIHDPYAKGMIFGLDLTHERQDLYRAVLEGIAYGVRHVLDTYAENARLPEAIAAVGGGTRNDVWFQAVSDAVRRPQVLRRETIGASYGNAFLAALGVGDAAEGDIEQWNPSERAVAPVDANRSVYDAGYRLFRQLYDRNKDLMRPT
ncbi:FGGY-family carbohydrate kinase [Aurantimonas sp. MSK8Z-1]|uniref:FGGY-family carbohydrate kinase n=1 Tax=Mangrovibrevibacter kandeliae TaxID=2968473 RepID=UPI002118D992|nr:FGGY-family carbohydrate kinase [Aurantimonas sp. MSK8Z-1]MCW4115709.1 FGGY-family carbohydrate kinase [Aurantimonas sp. MSK8Z-1]